MLASSNELTREKVSDVSSKVGGRRRVRVRVLQSKMRLVDAAVSSQTHQSLSNGAPPSQSALIARTARERKKGGAACELARPTLQTAVSAGVGGSGKNQGGTAHAVASSPKSQAGELGGGVGGGGRARARPSQEIRPTPTPPPLFTEDALARPLHSCPRPPSLGVITRR